MKAGDIMTTNVVSIRPDASARSIALLLSKNGISAVPVVDEHGAPLGMISEGDLMPRDESERDARRDWWLKALAEGEDLNPEFMQYLQSQDRCARDIMISPIVTIEENTELVDVAELLTTKRIKRVPVMRDGRMVGIVSRADLVKAVAARGQKPVREPSLDRDSEILVPSEKLEALTKHRKAPAVAVSPMPKGDDLSAKTLRELAAHHREEEAARRAEAQGQVAESHLKQARQLLAAKLTEESWQHMLRNARAAAQKGEEEQLLIRFPCELCTDRGRAVNAPDPNWPATLRGIAAEVFMRWKKELQPHGFGLAARVIDFPDGLPGDIGVYLEWGKREVAA
jgi:CBS domain-containing protein